MIIKTTLSIVNEPARPSPSLRFPLPSLSLHVDAGLPKALESPDMCTSPGARTHTTNQTTRSGPGEARTILLLHIISVRPSKQPLMVRTFLKVYMELGSYFLFLQETKNK